MRRLVIMNQKGGVGKTTTVANLGGALTRMGWRVLLVDLDPQAHLSIHFGFDPEGDAPTVYDLLLSQTSARDILFKSPDGPHLLPARVELAAVEVELVDQSDRHALLRRALDELQDDFDVALIDCPPSLGLLTLNGLAGAFEVVIPLQPHFLALQGLMKLGQTAALVRERLNPMLRIAGVIVCMQDTGTILSTEVIAGLEQILESQRRSGNAWSDARIYRTRIRRNIKLAECPSHQVSIFEYAPKSNGALDYAALAAEMFTSSPPREMDTAEVGDPPHIHERITPEIAPLKTAASKIA